MYADVAAQVLRTLGEEQLADGDGWRSVEPGDIAVLTRVNRDAVAVQRALASVGVPAVISMLSSVFATPSARDWLVLLSALARPGVGGFVSAAALTPFVGWTATELAEASDERRDQLADLLRTWSRVLDDHGVASLLEATAAAGLRERLVRLPDGERRLTDVRHVGEALHAAATDDGLGAAALLEWLRARVDEAGQDYAEERSRRLETDTAAVQVITVHASKGLQFPVVLVPFLWDKYVAAQPRRPSGTTATTSGCCTSAARAARGTTRPARPVPPPTTARVCASRTSPSRAPPARSSRGGRRRRTPSAAP